LRRKLVLSIAAAAVIVAVVAGSIVLFGSDESGFTKQANSILSPVQENTSALGDALEATKDGNGLPDVNQKADELDVAAGKAVDKARKLSSSNPSQGLLVDFLEATQAYARDVRAAGKTLTFSTAAKAEQAGRDGDASRQKLASADGDLSLPGGDAFDAVDHLSAVAKSCGGVPPDAVALVGDQPVTRAELGRLVSQATTNYRLGGGTLPLPVDQYQLLRKSAVVFLVDRIEFAQSAKELGVDVTTEEVRRRLDEIIKEQFGGEDAFRTQIARQKLTESQVENDVRAQLLQQAVLDKVSEGFRNKKKRKREWTLAMQKRFAKKTTYRIGGYAPPGVKGAPAC
jgi:hypothetical protein